MAVRRDVTPRIFYYSGSGSGGGGYLKIVEFEDQEEEYEKEVPSFDSLGNSNSTWPAKMSSSVVVPAMPLRKPKYKECLKNHVVDIGGHAVDGCFEFMAAMMEGSLDTLKCTTYNCHQNFHCKETEEAGYQ
ncbi:Zinc-finger homeodomain protein 2 [Abeliophyllum distichum]|uniref:Zinc-finger homeodomain protein 2 n=1 Tax=Abeliophyllum distichum TaxID=126358 RepID=A0ABD1V8Z0_9LAMI